jgi:hypothetical protein
VNSKQGARYIKKRMGNNLKEKILVYYGIIPDNHIRCKSSVLACGCCGEINGVDYKYCSKCSYPLVPSAFDELKEEERRLVFLGLS